MIYRHIKHYYYSFLLNLKKSPQKRMPLVFLLAFLFVFGGCSGDLYKKNIPEAGEKLDQDSFDKKNEWNALEARAIFLEYTESSADTNLFALYEKHDFKPLWLEHDRLSHNADQLIESLQASWKEGLSNDSYLKGIYKYLQEFENASGSGDLRSNLEKYLHLDILLSDAYLDYATDLHSGKVNPEKLDSVWEAHIEAKKVADIMEKAIENQSVKSSLDKLRPDKDLYGSLSEKLQEYLIIKDKGGWDIPGHSGVLKEGDSTESVIPIKKYLRVTGDLNSVSDKYMNSGKYDDRLKSAVEEFQRRHGLETDGIVGGKTLEEMNVPLEFRIDQIRVNMERLRWLPENYGEEYILINLPEFRLRYYKKGIKVEEMKIVIGEIENYTPVLKDTLRYIVFNPNWNLPRSIAVKEKLPKIKEDPYYLEKYDYLLLEDGYRGSDTIDPYEVDWEPVTKDNFPYYMVQKAGNYNALGKVKFLFPNNHAIYMHDTPADHLFEYKERDFSHGCIRLDQPFQLAEKILEDQMTYMEIQDILDSEEPTTITVEDLIKVFFLYRTAWVDDYDRINFREDLYNYDHMTAERL